MNENNGCSEDGDSAAGFLMKCIDDNRIDVLRSVLAQLGKYYALI